MHTDHTRRRSRRRGVTLVEMLVVVGLLLLLMSVIVSIFQYAAQSVSTSRAYQQIDEVLRRLDVVIRQDLAGVTAPLNPPIDPDDQKGYFEYSEQAFADLQGEDTDDIIRFTVKAPQGKPFSGRVWLPWAYNNVASVTSDFAEVIYFLRAGNLYRRVLLIVPQRRTATFIGATGAGGYVSPTFGPISWQGLNDVSAHPAPIPGVSLTLGVTVPYIPPIPNTLGDLTNRSNRFGNPRFTDDYRNNSTGAFGPDGIPDDSNGDGAPDYYPTLYPVVLGSDLMNDQTTGTAPARSIISHDSMPFPFIFPGAYSRSGAGAGSMTLQPYGAIHSLDPDGVEVSSSLGVQTPNHSPLASGDSLPIPTGGLSLQTWWGLPTWKETASPNWADPVYQLNNANNTPYGSTGVQTAGLSWTTMWYGGALAGFLPPMSAAYRIVPQPFSEFSVGTQPNLYQTVNAVWEDDLIATNVRSFDIKAYDPNAGVYNLLPDYYDLGYGSNPFITGGAVATANHTSTNAATLATLGHEGRMPPLFTDNRLDAQWPGLLLGQNNARMGNVGDYDTSGATIRMMRTYDTWSTDYTNAPDVPIANPVLGPPFAQAIYPSYPAPYPVPLRGIQIQIRINDPRGKQVKSLTIRQDLTDNIH